MSTELEEAVAALEGLASKKRPHPARHDARALLISLGTLALEGDSALKVVVARVHAATGKFSERWDAVAQEEMQLASAEYVTSVDERYLGMPDYDFDYTTAARQRLEARLAACTALGLELPEGMRKRIADADSVYASYGS